MVKKFLLIVNTYYQLTKPGIIFGNLFTAIAGFFVGTKHGFIFSTFAGLIIGTACIIASACVLNNYFDREIDSKMERTKNRAFVRKIISVKNALLYGTTLGIGGVFILYFFTNMLTLVIGIIGFFSYVVVYTFYKRTSHWATIIGTIPGSASLVAGYCAVTNKFDLGAVLLFLLLALWQVPHFYAIAIRRIEDYSFAGIPVFPVKKNILTTKIYMLLYIICFSIIAFFLFVFHYVGLLSIWIVGILCISWIGLSIKGLYTFNTKDWAKKMFIFSLIVLTILSFTFIGDAVITKKLF